MRTILKNFFSVMRRFKMAGLLNVLGLSVAFTAFMVIMMQVDFDRYFDRAYTHAECIYRVDLKQPGGYRQCIVSRPVSRLLLAASPHIVAGALYNQGGGSDLFFSVDRGGSKMNFREAKEEVTPEYPQVFGFRMAEGDANALSDPEKVLLPLSLARKLFAGEAATGKQLLLDQPGRFYTVGGVYHDFPRHVSVQNAIYVSIDPKENYDAWGNWNYSCFVRLDSPANAADVQEGFKKAINAKDLFGDEGAEKSEFELHNLAELHFDKHIEWDVLPKASHSTLLVLIAISFIIVVIAAINFTNFSTALAPMRIKSINTQKVLGSSESVLRAGLVSEALGISIVAYLLALLWVVALQYTPVASFTDADMSLGAQQPIVWMTGLLAVVVGLAAGLYPAHYMTSFQPALVLKGSFGLSPKGRKLRNMLIGIQFIASFALIIGAMFMYLQNYYMQHAPLGYDKDAVIVTDMNERLNQSREVFSEQVKTYAGIEDVAYAEFLMSSQDGYMGWGRMFHDKNIHFQCLPVDPSFLRVMGIEVNEGRSFRPEDALAAPRLIFNERARTEFEMQLNEKIDTMEIIGFVPDVKFASFRTAVEPMAFLTWGKKRWNGRPLSYNYAYVKVKGGTDLKEAFQHVRQSLKKIDPEYPYRVRFFDEVLNRTYEKEQKISSMITLFSVIAVFISMVGVFGLVVFDSEYRRREISVRKVLGSSTTQILILFNRTYFRIILVCFVLAAPLAWYTVHRWLENFAYRTPMYWWVYGVAFLIVAVITVITVTFQNWRAANDNPVNSIKAE